MKLSNLQKHYQRTFNANRRHTTPGKAPMYVKNVKSVDTNIIYNADKRTKQYAKYLGVQILLATSYAEQGKTKYSLRTKAPYVIDVICTINNVPCLIVFSNNKVHAIHMGYDPVEDTFNDYVVLYNEGITIPASSVRRMRHSQQSQQFKFRLISHPHFSEEALDKELNDIVQTYNITDKEIPEELQFQLDTIVPHTQYYIPVYQRAIQIQHKIDSLIEQGKKCTVLHILRYAAGL